MDFWPHEKEIAFRAAKRCGCLPAPAALKAAADPVVMQDGIAIEAGGGGAGVDGQDAQAAARRQGGAGRPADDAVFLIGLRDAQTGDQVPGLVADEPVAEFLPLPGQARITGKGHPARVDDQGAAVALPADDRGQHGQGQILGAADSQTGHDEILENIHTGPDFRDAGKIFAEKGRGCGADADHRTGEAGFPQQPGRRIGRGAFLHGKGGDGLRGGQVIGGARMGQDAADFLAAIPQQGGDGRQAGIVGAQAGPVAVAVYLQQHGQTAVPLPGKVHQQPGAFLIVQHHAQVDAALAQFGHTLQFVGSDTDGVTDVAHTACVSFRRELFPTRDYDTFSLPSGVYQSLRVTIGEGAGHNWWCVIFPSLCVPATTDGFVDAAAAGGFSDAEIGLMTRANGAYTVKFRSLELLQALKKYLFGE